MQIQAIESFLMVYEMQNMSKASAKLFITQQCLSRQIKSLESELGVVLFERGKSGMHPTELCHRIYPELKKALAGYNKARNICCEQKSGSAAGLTIALASGMSNYFSIGSISMLARRFSGKNLMIEECPGGECSKMLLEGKADMAFLLEPFDDTMLEHILIRQDYGCIVMRKNHPLAAEKGPIPLSELHGVKIVSAVKTNCATEHFERYCSQAGVYPQCVASVSNIVGFINTLTEDDIAVTILSYIIPQLTNPDIVIREVINPSLIGKCHCCFRKDSEDAELLRSLMLKIKESAELMLI
ncbi:MAG: LysR family transcriptional regulator [Oscillospiraceae bacterium]|nr:LysR family transcriptional regulator [Oscillospiraceae bacterium]